jgi:hypothetical protein
MLRGSGRFAPSSPATVSCGAASRDGAAVTVHVVMDPHCPGAHGKRHPSDVAEASQPAGVEPDRSVCAGVRTEDSRPAAAACLACAAWRVLMEFIAPVPRIAHSVPLASSESCRTRAPESAATKRRREDIDEPIRCNPIYTVNLSGEPMRAVRETTPVCQVTSLPTLRATYASEAAR